MLNPHTSYQFSTKRKIESSKKDIYWNENLKFTIQQNHIRKKKIKTCKAPKVNITSAEKEPLPSTSNTMAATHYPRGMKLHSGDTFGQR